MLVRQSTGSAGKGKNLIGLFDESIVSLIGFKILTRSSTLLLAVSTNPPHRWVQVADSDS